MAPLLSMLLALLAGGPALAGALSVPGLRGSTAESASQVQLLGLKHDHQRVKGPKSPGWFGDFSQEESSFTSDATTPYAKAPQPKRVVEYGKDPGSFPSVFNNLRDKPASWYEESPSGAWWDAYQTFYPAAPDTVMNNAKFNEPWRDTPQGWLQDYDYKHSHTKASWFDSQTLQWDGYGRKRVPMPRPFLAVDGWEERAVNTSLMCGPPGCTATAQLNLYDPNTMEGGNCKIGMMVHPTDYEDSHSVENVEWIEVNGKMIGSCNPGTNACDEDATLYPCFDNHDITELMTSSGSAEVNAKITEYVDECPYEGNLFSAVITITCMMRVIPDDSPPPAMAMAPVTDGPTLMNQQQMENALMNVMSSAMNPDSNSNSTNPLSTSANPDANSDRNPDATTIPPGSPMQNSPAAYTTTLSPLVGTAYANAPPELANNPLFLDMLNKNANPLPMTQAAVTPPIASTGNVLLQCEKPNCTATASLDVNPMMSLVAQNGGSCSLSVAVNQTDFDDGFGNPELIEYVAVSNVSVAQNVEPGKNPCTSASQGTNVTAADMVYTVVANYDVTQLVNSMTMLPVAGKISDQVDECASQGFLLDGLARIDCFPR